jgi:hypothetical protein
MKRPGRVLCNAPQGALAMMRPGLKGVLDPTQERPTTNSTVKAPPHGRLFSRIGLLTQAVTEFEKLHRHHSPGLKTTDLEWFMVGEWWVMGLLVKVTVNWGCHLYSSSF